MRFNRCNTYVSPKAKIGQNVLIGDNAVIYDNVEIGDDSTVCDYAVIGEPLMGYYRDPAYENPATVIGPNAFIRSHSIIYARSTMGANFSTGHHVTIREDTRIGESCSVGTLSDIEGDVKIGNYTRLHSNVHIAQTCTIGDYVFMFPYTVMTNDPYPPSDDIKGGSIGDYTQVCVHSIILPGVKVGKNCLIGANSVVNRALKDYSFAMGNPAKVMMDIRKYVAVGKGRLYPWMYRFDKRMPWAGIGYDKWLKLKGQPAD